MKSLVVDDFVLKFMSTKYGFVSLPISKIESIKLEFTKAHRKPFILIVTGIGLVLPAIILGYILTNSIITMSFSLRSVNFYIYMTIGVLTPFVLGVSLFWKAFHENWVLTIYNGDNRKYRVVLYDYTSEEIHELRKLLGKSPQLQ